jgi:ribosomal protein S16
MTKEKLIELRCKAWGITEDEYYCNQCSDFSLEDMARAYRRGKNKGARDKAIQNVGFYQKQMQDIYDKKNKQIQIDAEQIRALQKQNGELTDKLTKAKEIIKTFLGFAETFGYSPSMDKFISDTEQFLNSEVEK